MKDPNLVVILIITHKPRLEYFEEISVKQCFKVLDNYPITFICPEGMDISYYEEEFPLGQIHFIDAKWLSSYQASNRLKVTPLLYKTFQKYEYILFHEPDAFVFRDELEYWCSLGYDYIGAPWFKGLEKARSIHEYIGVGNSGFSLRKVSSHLKALYSFKYIYKPVELLSKYRKTTLIDRLLVIPRLIRDLSISNNSFFLFNNFKKNEDIFWCNHIAKSYKWFHISGFEEAVKFSFETIPEQLFDHLGDLPFGCHAWWRYNPDFWKKHIEKCGYDLEKSEL